MNDKREEAKLPKHFTAILQFVFLFSIYWNYLSFAPSDASVFEQ